MTVSARLPVRCTPMFATLDEFATRTCCVVSETAVAPPLDVPAADVVALLLAELEFESLQALSASNAAVATEVRTRREKICMADPRLDYRDSSEMIRVETRIYKLSAVKDLSPM